MENLVNNHFDLRRAYIQDTRSSFTFRLCVWVLYNGCEQYVLVYGKEKVSKNFFINLLSLILRGTSQEIRLIHSRYIDSETTLRCVSSLKEAKRFFKSLS